ncbi:AAEL011510-PA [Aedes aegypti]|uniref:Multiple inositol polyphosphate phosphatase 1 n=2 Tax=Aedes aegypti TaxID=7159 RepID=A0A8W7I2S7_AEDAE|nr:multiple inositol polyphosphate phosphatase 1 [Aedes aegypti]XP_021697282.1 multiple inositol polyphosphate phosphatase 1 [Aedes aegypti]XP_021697283.1 multiple inositol polyphosphate phosphatase 1 [Aedes aegypti]XP_021697284.1 multiple inositol polyphosphate phosphatase 1 [Aedes aegypti]XP_021697285.1 multiple inositol polyphosphate phosphatase 1 [Aedes aegypti]EAT36389.1 AAEL011510-PA [Aedes aegypti]
MTDIHLFIFTIVMIVSAVQPFQFKSSRCCEDYCYSLDQDRSQSKHYGTKTAYEVIRGPESSQEHVVPNCSPSKFWLLARHGTRLPGKKDIESLPPVLNGLRESILANYDTRYKRFKREHLCPEDVGLLRNWQWDRNITVAYESVLTDQGWDDLKLLAMREKDRFFEILSGPYDEQRYLFKHTNSQRTEASFKAFVEGLFGNELYDSIPTKPDSSDDVLLKPYDFCPAYDANEDKISEPDSELSKFLRSPLYINTLADISTRLGFRQSLSSEQVEAMWNACRFEQAWNLQLPSPWCSVFTKGQVQVMEYKEDLNYYYQNGYGSEVGSDLSCHAMADMLKHLGRVDGEQVIAYFTHDSAIQLFLVALGAMEDREALRADNYYAMEDRNFRSSELAPFAANIAVVRYECEDSEEPEKVMFFLNEKSLKFDWCTEGICDWSEVIRRYERFIDGDCAEMYCR